MEVRDGARRVVVSYSNVPLRGCGVGAIVILSPSSTQGKLREGSAIGSTADSSSPSAPQNDSAGEPGDTCEIRTPPKCARASRLPRPVLRCQTRMPAGHEGGFFADFHPQGLSGRVPRPKG